MSEPLLSDAELSERIANVIEPMPNGDECWPEAWGDSYYSPKQCRFQFQGVGMQRSVAHPRDMVNDPAMTVMLLEKLIGEMGLIEIGGFTDTTGAHGFSIRKHWAKNVYACNRHIGKAVALAFAKANGIAQ